MTRARPTQQLGGFGTEAGDLAEAKLWGPQLRRTLSIALKTQRRTLLLLRRETTVLPSKALAAGHAQRKIS